MIKSKENLQYYLEQDRLALYEERITPNFFKDEIWKWEILLRKNEYVTNCLTSKIYLPYKVWIKWRFYNLSVKLGFSIPMNCFGPDLSIAHYGTIVVGNAKVGKNCRIQEGVNIGATGGGILRRRLATMFL